MEVQTEVEIVVDSVVSAVDFAVVTAVAGDVQRQRRYSRIQYIRWTGAEDVFDLGHWQVAIAAADFVRVVAAAVVILQLSEES